MKYLVIADSGANFHMFKEHEVFTSLTPAQGQVILGDGRTRLPIHGIGSVTCKIGDNILQIDEVCYIPGLAESIYSLFCHIQSSHHILHSSFEEGLHIVFPDFKSKALLGENDIYLDFNPFSNYSVKCLPDTLQDSSTHYPHGYSEKNTDSFCWNLKQEVTCLFGKNTDSFCRNLKQEVTCETKSLDNLLKSHCQYYKEVKTKRQLSLEVPVDST